MDNQLNEAETRAEYIDPALKAAGWGVVEGSRLRREFKITEGRLIGHGKRAKAEIADYVLVYKNTPLGIIEAKAWDKPLTLGAAQAKGYAKMMGLRFTYATKGRASIALIWKPASKVRSKNIPHHKNCGT